MCKRMLVASTTRWQCYFFIIIAYGGSFVNRHYAKFITRSIKDQEICFGVLLGNIREGNGGFTADDFLCPYGTFSNFLVVLLQSFTILFVFSGGCSCNGFEFSAEIVNIGKTNTERNFTDGDFLFF